MQLDKQPYILYFVHPTKATLKINKRFFGPYQATIAVFPSYGLFFFLDHGKIGIKFGTWKNCNCSRLPHRHTEILASMTIPRNFSH
jgi:hypothetical protein